MSIFDTTGAESCRRCGENARAEVERLQAENEKLRELVAEIWPIAEYAGYEHELRRAHELMRELGYEEVEQ